MAAVRPVQTGKKMYDESLNASKIDEFWELEDAKKTYRVKFHEESDSDVKTCKFQVFQVEIRMSNFSFFYKSKSRF